MSQLFQTRNMWKRPARDAILRAHVGNLRVSAVLTRNTIAEGARRWALAPTAEPSRLWAEYMAGTVMLSSFYKGEERIKTAVRASNTNDEIFVEAMAVGEVRGKAALPSGHASHAFGNGQMQVSKILYGAAQPYVTTIPASGFAELDWQAFYDASEQVPTIVRIDHAIVSESLQCCGLTVQKMPESAPHDRKYDLSDLRFDTVDFSAGSVNKLTDIVDYLNELIPKAELTQEQCRRIPLDFFCRCSKQAFASRMADLGKEDIHRVMFDAQDQGIDLTCHFCNESYHFSFDELRNLGASK